MTPDMALSAQHHYQSEMASRFNIARASAIMVSMKRPDIQPRAIIAGDKSVPSAGQITDLSAEREAALADPFSVGKRRRCRASMRRNPLNPFSPRKRGVAAPRRFARAGEQPGSTSGALKASPEKISI